MTRLLAVLTVGVVLAGSSHPPADPVAEHIRRILASEGQVQVRGERLTAADEMRRFYGQRAYRAAWGGIAGGSVLADSMLAAVRDAGADGLRPEDYHATTLEAAMLRVARAPLGPTAAERAELDVLLSDAFLTLASHRLRGRVDPVTLHAGWKLRARVADLCALLTSALAHGAPSAALRTVDPTDPEYGALRDALAQHRAQVDAGWPVVGAGVALRPGDSDPRVVVLRARLARESGKHVADTSWTFDAALEQEVRAFQRRRGLEEDGVVGPATRAALSVPAERRVRQLVLAMERLRWQGERDTVSVEVAIPAFELRLREGARTVMVRRIIGGRPDWPTPIFGSMIDAVTFSPYWNVPPRIAALEVLPHVRRDPSWLARENMRVLSGWGAAARVLDASAIDWKNVTAANFRYRFRQEPGPGNPLGGVKFSIPNRWDVYLHDTSAPRLFDQPLRSFSHGCMRLDRPLDLAEYLLRDTGIWTRAAIEAAASAAVERTVRLRAPVPFHVVYRTAWVDDTGTLHFRDDVYGHDERLARELGASGAVQYSAPAMDRTGRNGAVGQGDDGFPDTGRVRHPTRSGVCGA